MIEAVEMTEAVGTIEVVETTEIARMNEAVEMTEEEDRHLHLTRVAMNEPIEMTEVTGRIETIEKIEEEDPPLLHPTRVVKITIVVTERAAIAAAIMIAMTDLIETDADKQAVKIKKNPFMFFLC